ncbi:TetR/AcrR family transcriptional regulator [Amycolatopsis sp. FDAARGOS 1241]|uniref:TetR/AcrR family transcriptional regulator n=1 Tax=Amycolatopsis sp. FDAARGOS 1241 TaxID=2778070 RepID=UPI00194EEA58|nr:TetR/AcrR family transcriptional regulator [Amycolatopsis sp. FDAARGOS 1241]QRP42838.1 TetR family transcriptional regulator [Amycolatopsis sp. FDAARGOS 1241]
MPKSGIDARRQAALKEGSAAYLARREEIIRAAADVFRQQGYEGATLLDVAKSLGTDRASLYYYIGSKEELLQEIVRNAIQNVLEAAETIKRSRAGAPEKIKALITSMVDNYVENYPYMSIYTQDLGRIARQESDWATDVIDRTRRYEAVVRAVLAKGQKDGTVRSDVPVDLIALSLFGMINWMHRWHRPDFKFSADQIADSFTKIYLEGSATDLGVEAIGGRSKSA